MGAREIKPQYSAPPETQQMKDYAAKKYFRDPRIPVIYGNAKKDFAESYKNVFGAYTTPAVRDAAIRANNFKLDQAYAEASMAENAQANNAEMQHSYNVAQMYRPQMYMPQYRENPWMTGLGIAAGVAGSAMGAF